MTTIGSRLKKLRIENGYSQRQVAEYLEIDQSNLSKIENNKRKLNWFLSDKLMSLYNCTPEYLLGETDIYIKPKISFRSKSEIDLNAVSKINKLTYHLNILRGLENEKVDFKLPQSSINLKRKWGIDDYSPIDIVTVLHQNIPNLTIVWFPMKKDVSGACYKKDGDSIIFLNSSLSKGRQNFSLAHELYHLLDNENNKDLEDAYFSISSVSSGDEDENKANDFASKFQMSDMALYDFMERNNIETWTLDDIIKCEQYFKLNHNDLLCRLLKTDLIDNSQFKEFSEDISIKAALLGYDTSLYEACDDKKYFSIGHMIPLADKSYKEGKIAKGRRKDIFLELFREDLVY